MEWCGINGVITICIEFRFREVMVYVHLGESGGVDESKTLRMGMCSESCESRVEVKARETNEVSKDAIHTAIAKAKLFSFEIAMVNVTDSVEYCKAILECTLARLLARFDY